MAFIHFSSSASRRIILLVAKVITNFGGWLVYKAARAFRWIARLYLLILIIIALLYFGTDWIALVSDLRGVVEGAAQTLKNADFDDPSMRNVAYILGGGAAALIALATAPFAIIKAWVNERQATTSEQVHITERITKSVEQLGAERPANSGDRDLSRPNLEVRLGAIYALERIAEDSERDHIPIMETLCAYIRENSNAHAPYDFPLPDWQEVPTGAERKSSKTHWGCPEAKLRYENARDWTLKLPPIRADVQAAITVVGRRPFLRRVYERSRGFNLDLRSANLQRVDLSALHLGSAMLSGARLEGAVLGRVRLEGADLSNANLTGANIRRAKMEGAILSHATLEGATLSRANLDGAILNNIMATGVDCRRATFTKATLVAANFDGALFRRAKMVGADLSGANATAADLRRANLEGAVLCGAKMELADLSRAKMDGANLGDAHLYNVDFEFVDLRKSNLKGADIRGANIGLTALDRGAS